MIHEAFIKLQPGNYIYKRGAKSSIMICQATGVGFVGMRTITLQEPFKDWRLVIDNEAIEPLTKNNLLPGMTIENSVDKRQFVISKIIDIADVDKKILVIAHQFERIDFDEGWLPVAFPLAQSA